MKKQPPLHFGVITLMPEMFQALSYGIVGRALKTELATVNYWNPREWATDIHKTVDDKPYGGGPGMVMMYQPLALAIECAKRSLPPNCKTVYLSPQGKKIEQHHLNAIVENRQHVLFVAGRYEGIDERIIDRYIDEEWSVGDFVISGGELAAMTLLDAIIRLIPGALGHQASHVQESFMHGLLDYPHYTRPDTIYTQQSSFRQDSNNRGESVYIQDITKKLLAPAEAREACNTEDKITEQSIDEMPVPAVLLSGDHQAIERWRRKQSLGKTWLKRPELLNNLDLSELDKQLLDEFKTLKE